MGNSHGLHHHHLAIIDPKGNELRRLSAPISPKLRFRANRHPNHISFASDHSNTTSTESATTPPMAHKNVDSVRNESGDTPSSTQRYHYSPGPSSERRMKLLKRSKAITMEENERRLKFVSSFGSLTMRSFDTGEVSDVEVTMKPLKDRSRSLSPLKQLKTYTFRSTPSEESILSELQQGLIRQSWQAVTAKLEVLKQSFGFFVFRRVFERNPLLKRPFQVEEYDSLDLLPEDHPFYRQMRLFASVVSLAVRNVDELEMEIAPVVFRYGQRHYNGAAREYFNEETVRLVCSQVVCTIADLLEVDVDPICMEAWIEMMRYVGCKLLDGFNYERTSQNKKLAANTSEHSFYGL